MKERKLIYILNHYSDRSSQHFFHVVNLLERMGEQGIKIVLVIEKCERIPSISNRNITVVAQKESNKVKRIFELQQILKKFINKGYRKIFIRISMNAAIMAILLAKKYNAEVYFWQSGDNLTYDRQKKGTEKLKYIVTSYSKLVYIKNNVSHFVTGPQTMVEYYKRELNIRPERMTLLYNDIDTNRFSMCSDKERVEFRKKAGIDPDKKVILFVHRLTPIKRFHFQLPYVIEQAEFRKLNTLLVIAGSGPDYEKVVRQVEDSKYKDLIKMVGAVPNREIMKYYQMADVFINPSYSEGFPRVVLEAMACGLPVVATGVGGTNDIVGPLQADFIIDKDDRELFRDSVRRLLIDELLRKRIASENLQTVKRYSTEVVADMYIRTIFQ